MYLCTNNYLVHTYIHTGNLVEFPQDTFFVLCSHLSAHASSEMLEKHHRAHIRHKLSLEPASSIPHRNSIYLETLARKNTTHTIRSRLCPLRDVLAPGTYVVTLVVAVIDDVRDDAQQFLSYDRICSARPARRFSRPAILNIA